MSNYDVIESYIIDFTTFNNRDDAIINNNKFVFTGNVVFGINYERIQVEKYNSYKILIKGLTGSIYYYYRNADGVENHIIFNKDGVYDIPVSYKQGTEGIIMGYTCNSTTECTVTQLPTSILKDFSGNKHNAYLYGFKRIIMVERKVIIDKLNELVDSKITIIADTNPFLKIFKPFIDKAANNYICKINKFLQMIEEENGLIDIETLLGKSIDNLIVSPVQEYPDMFKGVTIGNGKIRIGLPGINKDIVLDANDIETFKQSLVK